MAKVTIAPDSFKGSLSAPEVAAALAHGIRSVVGDCEVVEIPVADGGEGTAEVLIEALGAERVELATFDPLGRPIRATYGVKGEVAIMEIASASGLTLLGEGERNAMESSTYGSGVMMANALRRGCRRIILGLGGSATNDCCTGLLSALGWRFRDSEGEPMKGCGRNLPHIATIDTSGVMAELEGAEIVCLTDINSPLTGPTGAARLFVPQKGASPEEIALLEEGALHFASLAGGEYLTFPGAGAAGGVGFGLKTLAGAELTSGIEWLLEAVGFDRRAEGSCLVVTGEGRVDNQTLLGKAPGGVFKAAARLDIPTIVVGGSVVMSRELAESGFVEILAATPEGMTIEEAMRPEVANENLRRVGKQIGEYVKQYYK